jgi:hypothetical protein
VTTRSRSRRIGETVGGDGNPAGTVPSRTPRHDEESSQGGRVYSGLVKNDDGENTYTGIAILFDSVLEDYLRPESAQREFDEAINSGARAHAVLDGEEIVITRAEVRVMP